MSKIAILGDCHFGVRNDAMIFHNHMRKFFEGVFFPYLLKHNIKHIVQVGDIFDRRKYINFKTMNESIDYFFSKLVEYGITMDVLVGNHDIYYRESLQINSPDIMLQDKYPNISIHQHPTEVTIGGLKTLMVPWICKENKTECMAKISSSKARVLFGHLELSGFQMYKGQFSLQGESAGRLFDGYELVMSGHYHTKSSKDVIHYLGTPYEMTWADHGDKKGFHILDTDTLELEHIENDNYMFYKLIYDDTPFAGESYEAMVKDIKFEKFTDKFVKLLVREKYSPYWFDMFLDDLANANIHHLQIVEDAIYMDSEYDEEILNETEDTLSILSSYVQQLDIKEDERIAVDSVLKSCYNDAIAML